MAGLLLVGVPRQRQEREHLAAGTIAPRPAAGDDGRPGGAACARTRTRPPASVNR
jgi:hypothetical protein